MQMRALHVWGFAQQAILLSVLVVLGASADSASGWRDLCALGPELCGIVAPAGLATGSLYTYHATAMAMAIAEPTARDSAESLEHLHQVPARLAMNFTIKVEQPVRANCSTELIDLTFVSINMSCPGENEEGCAKVADTALMNNTVFKVDSVTGEYVGVFYPPGRESVVRVLIGALQSINAPVDYSKLSALGDSYTIERPSMRVRGQTVEFTVTLESVDNETGVSCFTRRMATAKGRVIELADDFWCLGPHTGVQYHGSDAEGSLGGDDDLVPVYSITPDSTDENSTSFWVIDAYDNAHYTPDGANWSFSKLGNVSAIVPCPSTDCVFLTDLDGAVFKSCHGEQPVLLEAPCGALALMCTPTDPVELILASADGKLERGFCDDPTCASVSWSGAPLPIDEPQPIFKLSPLSPFDADGFTVKGVGFSPLSTLTVLTHGDEMEVNSVATTSTTVHVPASSAAGATAVDANCPIRALSTVLVDGRLVMSVWNNTAISFVEGDDALMSNVAAAFPINASCEPCGCARSVVLTNDGDLVEVTAIATLDSSATVLDTVTISEGAAVYSAASMLDGFGVIAAQAGGRIASFRRDIAGNWHGHNLTIDPYQLPLPEEWHTSESEVPALRGNSSMTAELTNAVLLSDPPPFQPCVPGAPPQTVYANFTDSRWTPSNSAPVPSADEAAVTAEYMVRNLTTRYDDKEYVDEFVFFLGHAGEPACNSALRNLNTSMQFLPTSTSADFASAVVFALTRVSPQCSGLPSWAATIVSQSTYADIYRLQTITQSALIQDPTEELAEALASVAASQDAEDATLAAAAAAALGALSIDDDAVAESPSGGLVSKAHVVERLAEVLRTHPEPGVKAGALLGLGNLGHPDASTHSRPWLSHDDAAMRMAAIRALRLRVASDPNAAGLVSHTLCHDPSPQVRDTAATTLREAARHGMGPSFQSLTILKSIVSPSCQLTMPTIWTMQSLYIDLGFAELSKASPYRDVLRATKAVLRVFGAAKRAFGEEQAILLARSRALREPMRDPTPGQFFEKVSRTGDESTYAEAYVRAAADLNLNISTFDASAGVAGAVFGARLDLFKAGVSATYSGIDGYGLVRIYVTVSGWEPARGLFDIDLMSLGIYGNTGITMRENADTCSVNAVVDNPGIVNRWTTTFLQTTFKYGIPVVAELDLTISVAGFVGMDYGAQITVLPNCANPLPVSLVKGFFTPVAGASGSAEAKIILVVVGGGIKADIDFVSLKQQSAVGMNLESLKVGVSIDATETILKGHVDAYATFIGCCWLFDCSLGCWSRQNFEVASWPGLTFDQSLINTKACDHSPSCPIESVIPAPAPQLNDPLRSWMLGNESKSALDELPFQLPTDVHIFATPRLSTGVADEDELTLEATSALTLDEGVAMWNALRLSPSWSKYWFPVMVLRSESTESGEGSINASVVAIDCHPTGDAGESPCPASYRAILVVGVPGLEDDICNDDSCGTCVAKPAAVVAQEAPSLQQLLAIVAPDADTPCGIGSNVSSPGAPWHHIDGFLPLPNDPQASCLADKWANRTSLEVWPVFYLKPDDYLEVVVNHVCFGKTIQGGVFPAFGLTLYMTRSLACSTNRARSLSGLKTVPGRDRDEFPYASSSQGGCGARIMAVDPHQNRVHGGQLSKFYRVNGIVDGSRYAISIPNIGDVPAAHCIATDERIRQGKLVSAACWPQVWNPYYGPLSPDSQG